MRPTLLIVGNYVREQRWPALGLCLYAIGNALLFGYMGGHRVATEDVYFYTRQQALFVAIFGLFLMSSAIYNDRRSRRILAVLSKAITRSKYLASLWFGVTAIATVYGAVIAGCVVWLCSRATLDPNPLLISLVLAWVAALAATAAALFFSTVLHPLFASAAAVIVLGAGGGLPHASPVAKAALFPSYHLLEGALTSPAPHVETNTVAIAFAIVHAAIFFLLALAVFNRKDIAVAVE